MLIPICSCHAIKSEMVWPRLFGNAQHMMLAIGSIHGLLLENETELCNRVSEDVPRAKLTDKPHERVMTLVNLSEVYSRRIDIIALNLRIIISNYPIFLSEPSPNPL